MAVPRAGIILRLFCGLRVIIWPLCLHGVIVSFLLKRIIISQQSGEKSTSLYGNRWKKRFGEMIKRAILLNKCWPCSFDWVHPICASFAGLVRIIRIKRIVGKEKKKRVCCSRLCNCCATPSRIGRSNKSQIISFAITFYQSVGHTAAAAYIGRAVRMRRLDGKKREHIIMHGDRRSATFEHILNIDEIYPFGRPFQWLLLWY